MDKKAFEKSLDQVINVLYEEPGPEEIGPEIIHAVPSAQPDLQPTCNQLAKDINVPCKDTISRRDAIKYFTTLWECIDEIMDKEEWEDVCKTTANEIPSAPLYNEDELQIMQDLEWSQMEKMYELGKVESRWISCKERLPENYVDVLVWFEYYRYGSYNRLYQTYGIGTYSENYDSWTINHESGWHKLRVIAWQPLPEPYQPKGDES